MDIVQHFGLSQVVDEPTCLQNMLVIFCKLPNTSAKRHSIPRQQLEHDISNLVTMPNINVNQLCEKFAIMYKTGFSNISHIKLQKNAAVFHGFHHISEDKSKRETDYTDKPNN